MWQVGGDVAVLMTMKSNKAEVYILGSQGWMVKHLIWSIQAQVNCRWQSVFTRKSLPRVQENVVNMLGKEFFIGMLLPLGYVSVLLGSLITFSTLYRKRQASRWFTGCIGPFR